MRGRGIEGEEEEEELKRSWRGKWAGLERLLKMLRECSIELDYKSVLG